MSDPISASFPIITGGCGRCRPEATKPHPPCIPWPVAELAYSVYAARYGTQQTLKRLADRGGFHPCEMDELLPDWRERAEAMNAEALIERGRRAERQACWQIAHDHAHDAIARSTSDRARAEQGTALAIADEISARGPMSTREVPE